MKYLLVATRVVLLPTAILAQGHKIKCPGENTVEMRYCAGLSWEQSTTQLQRKILKAHIQQWHDATRAVCAHAYAAYKDGTIYPQLVVGKGFFLPLLTQSPCHTSTTRPSSNERTTRRSKTVRQSP